MQAKLKLYFTQFKIMLVSIYKFDKRLLIITMLNIMISAVAPFPFIILPKYILDELLEGNNYKRFITLVITFVITSFIINFINIIISNVMNSISIKMGFQINNAISLKGLDIDYDIYDSKRVLDMQDYAYKVTDDNNFVNLLNSLKNLFSQLFVFIGIIVIVIRIDLLLILFSVIIVFINSIITYINAKNQIKFDKEGFPYMRKIEYLSHIAGLQYRKDILIYNGKEYIKNKTNSYYNFVFGFFKRVKKSEMIGGNAINVVNHLFQFSTYVLLGSKVIKKIITIGDFTMYMNALNSFNSSCNGMISSVVDIGKRINYFYVYNEFMSLESKYQNSTRLISKEEHKNLLIEFDNVSFKYPDKDNYVLKNISLKIESGVKVALVGVNGAGKSTLVKLLLRLYDPSEGRILVNGVDIKEIIKEDYLSLFSAVFQDFQVLNFSVKENVSFSEENNEEISKKIYNLLSNNGLAERIGTLTKGIDTIIGRRFDEKGEELSGGELQKIAIARALYKDAPIIIMDEPTSALDPKAEHEIYEKFSEMTSKKTAIYISHRLASTHFCNKIMVLDNGELVEYGSHDELMGNNGVYEKLYKLQSKYYR